MTKRCVHRLTRRTLLRGAGVAMALPLFESLLPRMGFGAPANPGPQRIVAINIPLGFHGPSFFPTEVGANYTATASLKPAAAIRDKFTLISGTSHPDVDGGHSAEASFLTAAPHPGARSFKNTISLDQLIAKQVGSQTRFGSLTLGDQSLSWSANGVAIPAENDPGNAYSKLFLQGNAKQLADQRRRLEDGHSVIDVLLKDANAMQGKLSKKDQDKLEQYFTAVREAEQRLQKAEVWAKTPKPTIDASQPPRLPSEDITGRLKLHFDVIRLALQTDSTRVITLCGHSGSLVPPLKGVEKGYHALSHHGMTDEMIKQLEVIDRETIRIWAEFVQGLAETTEGDATLLDRTQVLLGSNLGNANAHTTNNLPIVLAGGRYKHGSHQSFDAKNNEPLANLFVTMIRAMGLNADSFGSSTGPLQGLEVAG